MTTVYLASPLGFSPEWKSYRDRIKQRLHELGCSVLDPWEGSFHTAIAEASAIQDWHARVAAFRTIAAQIGKANEEMIRSCDVVFGVLARPDTVSKIGFAAVLGVPQAEDAVRQWPQSGELIRGRTRIGEVESHFVGLRLGVGTRLALGHTLVVEWTSDYGDGRLYRNVTIAELRDGKAIRLTDNWGEPFTPPAWRGTGRAPGHDAHRRLATGRCPHRRLSAQCVVPTPHRRPCILHT